jgi:hypothetical protein
MMAPGHPTSEKGGPPQPPQLEFPIGQAGDVEVGVLGIGTMPGETPEQGKVHAEFIIDKVGEEYVLRGSAQLSYSPSHDRYGNYSLPRRTGSFDVLLRLAFQDKKGRLAYTCQPILLTVNVLSGPAHSERVPLEEIIPSERITSFDSVWFIATEGDGRSMPEEFKRAPKDHLVVKTGPFDSDWRVIPPGGELRTLGLINNSFKRMKLKENYRIRNLNK